MNSILLARIHQKLKSVDETLLDIRALLVNVEKENEILNLELVELKSKSSKGSLSSQDCITPGEPLHNIQLGQSFDFSHL